MKNLILFLSLSAAACAQDCMYKNLSDRFDFAVHVRSAQNIKHTDSLYVVVHIYTKQYSLTQLICVGSNLFLKPFTDCSNGRSYTTGINKGRDIIDADYGDLVVADFNFDGREDVAIKREQGGNAGPRYSYYLQDNKDFFEADAFLTATMGYFPDEFNVPEKKLVARVRANARQYTETVYQYDARAKKWAVASKKLVDFKP